jgi:DNA-binding transcriptional ArsR family regulator
MNQGAGGNQDKSIGPGAEPRLVWDIGTAYDFFMSLEVLHQPEQYGLRPSWAAGVRSRLPPAERKMLEDLQHFLWLPLHWISTLPEPKDAAAALWALRQIPAEQRPLQMINSYETPPALYAVLQKVAQNRAWDDGDLEIFRSVLSEYKKGHLVKDLVVYLDWFSRPEEMGELYLSALQAYYQGFFAEEEKRIAPVLRDGLVEAQELAARLPLEELIAELSQGVHFERAFTAREIVFIPGYWNTPLVIFPEIGIDRMAFLFGVRPLDMSLIPGEPVPDALLRVLKALADPTRLRILRYLSQETLTPAQLSRKLRLRAPTVTHHLQTLRLAGLVNISIESENEKGYTSRLDAVNAAFKNLDSYLTSDRPDGGEG